MAQSNELPENSIHPPTSGNPSPSEGLRGVAQSNWDDLDEILYKYAAHRDAYYSEYEDGVMTESEWIKVRDNIQAKTKTAIEAYRKQHELELLDRLIAQEWSFGEGDDAMAVPTRYIKAERERHEL